MVICPYIKFHCYMVINSILGYFAMMFRGRQWQCATVLINTKYNPAWLVSGSSKPRAAAGSQAEHPKLPPRSSAPSRHTASPEQTSLGTRGPLLAKYCSINISGIYSSVIVGKSSHRKRLKFFCVPLETLTKMPILWIKLSLSSLCVCP